MRLETLTFGAALCAAFGCSSTSSDSGGTGGTSSAGTSASAGGSNATGGASSAGTSAGGTSASGGSGGQGVSGSAGSGASGGVASQPMACDGLAADGTWENVTPPVEPISGADPCPYGGAFVIDPVHTGVVIRGSCNEGIWKSTDCGGSWVHLNTGENGSKLDNGRQWTFVIDPVDPDVLYTNSGYGSQSNGAFKSTNGGVDWTELWPPKDPDQASIVQYNFVGGIAMDPDDHTHLLITFHATCSPPHPEACFGESTDAGETWRMVDGQADWAGGEGQAAYFLDDSKTWLWGSQSNGLWRTSDSGATWTAVTDKQAQGHGAGQLYHAANGAFFLPVLNGLLRSVDGIEWNIVPNSGNVMAGMTGNGTTMWASRGFPWDPSTDLYLPFWTSKEDDGSTWSQMDSPMLSNGGSMHYDADHKLLYSSCGGDGLYRVVTE